MCVCVCVCVCVCDLCNIYSFFIELVSYIYVCVCVGGVNAC